MVGSLERKHRYWTQALEPGAPLSPSEQQSPTLILLSPGVMSCWKSLPPWHEGLRTPGSGRDKERS